MQLVILLETCKLVIIDTRLETLFEAKCMVVALYVKLNSVNLTLLFGIVKDNMMIMSVQDPQLVHPLGQNAPSTVFSSAAEDAGARAGAAEGPVMDPRLKKSRTF